MKGQTFLKIKFYQEKKNNFCHYLPYGVICIKKNLRMLLLVCSVHLYNTIWFDSKLALTEMDFSILFLFDRS